MDNGIYEVNFRASTQDFGSVLIVIKDGSVNGGDAHFLYRGTLTGTDAGVTASISVEQWKAGNRSVVGITNYKVEFKGTIANGQLKLSGNVTDHPQLALTVTGRKVAEAA